MKPNQYYISISVASLCAVLTLALLILGSTSRGLQLDVQKLQIKYQTQQDQINAGSTISQQIIPNLFKDMGSLKDNAGMKAILQKHGGVAAENKQTP